MKNKNIKNWQKFNEENGQTPPEYDNQALRGDETPEEITQAAIDYKYKRDGKSCYFYVVKDGKIYENTLTKIENNNEASVYVLGANFYMIDGDILKFEWINDDENIGKEYVVEEGSEIYQNLLNSDNIASTYSEMRKNNIHK